MTEETEWDKLKPFEKAVLTLLEMLIHNTAQPDSARRYIQPDSEKLVNSFAAKEPTDDA